MFFHVGSHNSWETHNSGASVKFEVPWNPYESMNAADAAAAGLFEKIVMVLTLAQRDWHIAAESEGLGTAKRPNMTKHVHMAFACFKLITCCLEINWDHLPPHFVFYGLEHRQKLKIYLKIGLCSPCETHVGQSCLKHSGCVRAPWPPIHRSPRLPQYQRGDNPLAPEPWWPWRNDRS